MNSNPNTDKRHNAPGSNKDYDFYYEGLEQGKLLIQQCAECSKLCHPPAPMCPHCHSVKKTARQMSGKGTVYSYVIHRHPPLPDFDVPHPVGLIELAEGVRVVGVLANVAIERIEVGMPVVADFYRHGDMATLRFVPVASANKD